MERRVTVGVPPACTIHEAAFRAAPASFALRALAAKHDKAQGGADGAQDNLPLLCRLDAAVSFSSMPPPIIVQRHSVSLQSTPSPTITFSRSAIFCDSLRTRLGT